MQKIILIFLLVFILQTATFSLEKNYFVMLRYNKVNVRYGPDSNSPIKYIYKKKFLPLKVIDKKEHFRKIIDHKKNSGWIHKSQLKKSKSLIVLSDRIIFTKPTKYSKPILKIQKGRLLLLKKCKNKWCKVETENYSGWIKVTTTNIWGTSE